MRSYFSVFSSLRPQTIKDTLSLHEDVSTGHLGVTRTLSKIQRRLTGRSSRTLFYRLSNEKARYLIELSSVKKEKETTLVSLGSKRCSTEMGNISTGPLDLEAVQARISPANNGGYEEQMSGRRAIN